MELIKAKRQKVWGWPAALNFILGGMAAGLYLLALPLISQDEGSFIVSRQNAIKLIAPSLVCLGFLSLSLEAGRPRRVLYLLRNLRTSWMSLETLTGLTFISTALLDLVFPSPGLRWIAALAALGFILSQSLLLYSSSALAAWNIPLLPAAFAASGFTAGSGLLLLLMPPDPLLIKNIGALGLFLISANLVLWLLYIYRSGDDDFQIATTGLRRPWSLLSITGIGHLLPILLLLASVTWPNVSSDGLVQFAGLVMIGGTAAQKISLFRTAGMLRGIVLERNGPVAFSYRPKQPTFGPLKKIWARFWMRLAGPGPLGRGATWLASLFAPPGKARVCLADWFPKGYISPSATLYHSDLTLHANVFVGERVLIFQRKTGGPVEIGEKVRIYRDTIIETGFGGSLKIGLQSNIHPRCQINAYVQPIILGSRVGLAPNCALYSYNHSFAPGALIHDQGLDSKGPIVIEDDAWLGVGVTVLSGVRIGKGAVVAAGSVVTRDIPAGGIACGVPARVIKMREDLERKS